MKKIPEDRLFVQVTCRDLFANLWLITLFRVNCEIYISSDDILHFDISQLEKVRSLFLEKNISARLHGPVYDPVGRKRSDVETIFERTLEFCRVLGSNAIVMHAEYDSKKYPSFEEWLKNSADIWAWIADRANVSGISVLLENHHEASAEAIIKILESVNKENLAACLDVAHFNAFSKKDIKACLDEYPVQLIKEIHLSDNMGDEDTHLALGRGVIDFPELFDVVDRKDIDAVYTIEAKNVWGVIAGKRFLKKIGRI